MPNRLAARDLAVPAPARRTTPSTGTRGATRRSRRARAEDKPLLVSIGYAACHWCHVMERESFEDPDVAALMNEHFVCVKVDREERPDVDAIYMDAVQAMTGHGGWPLNAFLTPDGVPFYAGTYFPPEPRQGMPSWRQVLAGVAEAWRDAARRRSTQAAATILPRLRGAAALDAPDGELDAGRARRRRRRRCGAATTASTAASARRAEVPGRLGDRVPARAAASARWPLHTLRAMAARRHVRPDRRRLRALLGRRALDRAALREDALRQRAARARVPARARRCRGEPFFRARVRGDARLGAARAAPGRGRLRVRAGRRLRGRRGQVLRLDAGRRSATRSATMADVAIAHFGDDARRATSRARTSPCARRRTRRTSPSSRRALLAAREQRVRPGLDDKRLTAWNALMISALADAGAALERAGLPRRGASPAPSSSCATCATRTAGCCGPTTAAGPSSPAYLEDHAFLLEALLTLYEATFDPRWFGEARALADDDPGALRRPASAAGFFSTADDHEPLIARRKDLEDTPIPSGAVVGRASACCASPRLTGEHRYEDAALGVLRLLHALAPAAPARVRPPAAGARLRARPRARGGDRRRPAPSRSSAWSAAASTPTWCWRAASATACRCWRAASRWTAARRRTCASTSRAGAR